MPHVILAPGLNIACIYAKKWHRGIIKTVKLDGDVTVSISSLNYEVIFRFSFNSFPFQIFFYDYGTVKTYNPNNVYFLKKSFSSFPAQAVACGLHNIKPIGCKDWPTKSTNEFINRVLNNIPLIAMVYSKDEEVNYSMYLIDINYVKLFSK